MGNELRPIAKGSAVQENYQGIDKEYARLFHEHDVNKNNLLSQAEFVKLVQRFGLDLQKESIRNKFFVNAKMLPPKPFRLDLKKFLELMHSNRQMLEIEQTFAMLDLDGDGVITLDEVKQSMEWVGDRMGESKTARFLQKFDKNHDHIIAFEEFAKVINSNNILTSKK